MRRCKRRSDASRKEWLRQADQWDGTAYVYDPIQRRNVLAEWYKDQMAEPMMWHFDRLPVWERQRIANSRDGYGQEVAVIIR